MTGLITDPTPLPKSLRRPHLHPFQRWLLSAACVLQ
jgi:hypothetical protein